VAKNRKKDKKRGVRHLIGGRSSAYWRSVHGGRLPAWEWTWYDIGTWIARSWTKSRFI